MSRGLELRQGALHGTLTRAERQGECRRGPGFTIGEQSRQRRVRAVDRRRQEHHAAGGVRHEREAVRSRANLGEAAQVRAQAADLDPQAGAVRLVCAPRAENGGDQRVACGALRMGLREHPQQREQHGTAIEPYRVVQERDASPAAVDHQPLRGEERFHIVEEQRPRRVHPTSRAAGADNT